MDRYLLVALALCLLAGAVLTSALLWHERRARRLRRRPGRLRHPVVLAHGLFGFDAVEVRGARYDYFRGIPAVLRGRGCAVHTPRLGATASVAERAARLAACVRELPDRKVNIVAHSMGGLDARYAIAHLGLAARVASLTTIGTPHLGTPLADLGSDVLCEKLGLRRALARFGVAIDAFHDLTRERVAALNAAVRNAPGVAYASVVGAAQARHRTNPLLVPGWLYLRTAAGDNDGVVPAEAQRWGDVLAEIDADHWAQIGWSRHFDAAEFYDRLVAELRGRGF
jgi:triacylglycerol lipase